MAKTKSNSKKRTKARKSPRAMALTVSESKLRGPRQPRADFTKQSHSSSPAKTLRPTQLNGKMPILSPWVVLLHQQALLARGFFIMMEAQQQFAKLWPLPGHRLAQVGQR
jgi:hypothetical protein